MIPAIVQLAAHVEGDSWQGIPTIGPFVINDAPPATPAARVRLRLSRVPPVVGATREFDSLGEDAEIEIVDAATWEFSLPRVHFSKFTLPAGKYEGQLEITDTNDYRMTTHEVRMVILKNKTP